ncbi:MAG: hypothetical protein AAFQ53_15200, partial [Bacteroidota bacterium]
GLSNELIELPYPVGALVGAFTFLPFLLIAVAFVRKSLAEGTTFNVIASLLKRLPLGWLAARLGDERWLSRRRQPRLFWANVLFIGAVPGGLGLLSVLTLWLVILDMMTLLRFSLF